MRELCRQQTETSACRSRWAAVGLDASGQRSLLLGYATTSEAAHAASWLGGVHSGQTLGLESTVSKSSW